VTRSDQTPGVGWTGRCAGRQWWRPGPPRGPRSAFAARASRPVLHAGGDAAHSSRAARRAVLDRPAATGVRRPASGGPTGGPVQLVAARDVVSGVGGRASRGQPCVTAPAPGRLANAGAGESGCRRPGHGASRSERTRRAGPRGRPQRMARRSASPGRRLRAIRSCEGIAGPRHGGRVVLVHGRERGHRAPAHQGVAARCFTGNTRRPWRAAGSPRPWTRRPARTRRTCRVPAPSRRSHARRPDRRPAVESSGRLAHGRSVWLPAPDPVAARGTALHATVHPRPVPPGPDGDRRRRPRRMGAALTGRQGAGTRPRRIAKGRLPVAVAVPPRPADVGNGRRHERPSERPAWPTGHSRHGRQDVWLTRSLPGVVTWRCCARGRARAAGPSPEH
jgi:hypothetical protein